MTQDHYDRTTWLSWLGAAVFWLAAIGSAAIVALWLEADGHSRIVSALLGACVGFAGVYVVGMGYWQTRWAIW